MAISRPFLLALLGVALLGATVFAVQNARNTAADDATRVAEQTPAAEEAATPAAPTAEPAAAEPAALIESALSADVESAAFDMNLRFSAGGETNLIRVSGAFVDNGEREMPEAKVQLQVRVAGLELNESGGFVTTGERAWFTRAGTGYAVPRDIWSAIVEAHEKGGSSQSPDIDIDTDGWLKNVEEVGKDQVGGVQATHLRADVDSAKAITDIATAMSRVGQSGVPVPNAERRLRQSGLSNGELHVWVGEDEVFRRITLELSGPGDGGRRVEGTFSLSLSEVNEPQRIAKPAKVRVGMPGDPTYAQGANALLAGVANTVGLSAEELNIGAPITNSHLKAERAVADDRKVVIFFQNPRAHDDRAVANAVRELDRRTREVVVLVDYLENVDRYGTLLEDLGVNQAPAIVVIGKSGRASLVEGYIDGETLTQVVADAR